MDGELTSLGVLYVDALGRAGEVRKVLGREDGVIEMHVGGMN